MCFIIFSHVCICRPDWEYVHVSAGVLSGQRRWISQELELLVVWATRPGCWKLNSGITHVLNHRAHLSSSNLKVKGLNECSVEEMQYTKTRSTAMVFINLSTSFYNYIWQTFLPMLRIQHRPGICQGKSFITELSPGPHNIFWAVI